MCNMPLPVRSVRPMTLVFQYFSGRIKPGDCLDFTVAASFAALLLVLSLARADIV